MTDELADDQAAPDELAWRRQRAILHGKWDEAARYAALLAIHRPPTPDHAQPVGRTCPADYPVKAKRASKRYHLPGDSWYTRMRPDVCFATEAAAQQAGYRRAQR